MPIYEYVCRNCDHELEQLQKIADDPLTECPACGESTLKRKVSAAGFRLAGGGWYETDFKSDGRRNVAGASEKSGDAKPGGEKTKDAAPSETKSDSAAKSDVAAKKAASGTAEKKAPAKKESVASKPSAD